MHMIRPLIRIMGKNTLLADIDDEAIKHFKQRRMQEPLKAGSDKRPKAATINMHLVYLTTLLNQAREWSVGGRKVNVSDVRPTKYELKAVQRKPVSLGAGRLERLFSHLAGHAHGPIRLMSYTALRPGGPSDIKIEDIELTADRSHLLARVKGGKDVPVWLIPEAVHLIRDHMGNRTNGPLFVYGNDANNCACSACSNSKKIGKPILDISSTFDTARKAIGLPDLHMHDVRHHALRAITRKYGLKVAQQVAHHSDIATTAAFYADQEDRVVADALADTLGSKVANKSKTEVA
jgi:integrase